MRQQFPFYIRAIVILPDHLHAIWQLPLDDDNYSMRWANIKRCFTRQLLEKGYQFKQVKDGTYQLWQRRFWEHTIRHDGDLHRHINYIHINPVKHGLVKQVKEWPYSSFHYYCQQGLLDENWGDVEFDNLHVNLGERIPRFTAFTEAT